MRPIRLEHQDVQHIQDRMEKLQSEVLSSWYPVLSEKEIRNRIIDQVLTDDYGSLVRSRVEETIEAFKQQVRAAVRQAITNGDVAI